MKFEIKLDGETVVHGTTASNVSQHEFVAALMRVSDRFLSIRECKINYADRPTRDAQWDEFIEVLAHQHGFTAAKVTSRDRHRPLPDIRAMAASAWILATRETLDRTARRLGLHHTTVMSALERLDAIEKSQKDIRIQHQAAIDLCTQIICRT